MIKFSIVMPIYGVEKYIERSLNSILAQSYKNYEVIMVDDCTPDNAGEIAKSYSLKHDNFYYFKNPKNLGLSMTRNNGFNHVTGDYVLFLDSDDYIERNLLELVHNSLNKHPADVVVYGLIEEYFQNDKKIYSKIKCHKNVVIDDTKTIYNEIAFLEKETLFGYAWNKVYRTDLIRENKLLFRKIKMIEDVLFNLDYFNLIQKMNILNNVLYHYEIQNKNSLTSSYIPDYFELHQERINKIYLFLESKNTLNENSKRILAERFSRYFLSSIERQVYIDNYKTIKEKIYGQYESKVFMKLQPYMISNNRIQNVLFYFIKNKNVNLLIFVCSLISFLKHKFPSLFFRLKQIR